MPFECRQLISGCDSSLAQVVYVLSSMVKLEATIQEIYRSSLGNWSSKRDILFLRALHCSEPSELLFCVITNVDVFLICPSS